MQLMFHLADPAIHALIVLILLLISTNVFAQTAANQCPAGQFVVSELANIGHACSTVAYGNVTGTPAIPSAQVNSDWNAVSGVAQILNKPTIPVVQSYENTTQRLNPIFINKSASVAGGAGNAVFNITNDGTSTGTALCPNGTMLNSPNLSVNDATAPYQFSWIWSNSNKTMTVLAQKASGLAVLTFTLLGIPAPVPNGTSVNSTIICY